MIAATLTAQHEHPVAISVGDDRLVAVATRPAADQRSTAVVLLQGGALRNVSFERNRIAVTQARRFAEDGFLTVRFDYTGIGDSTGLVHAFDINDPPTAEVNAVLEWTRRAGAERIVLVAACMGARTALAVAAANADVTGVALGAMPIAVRTSDRRAAEWRMLSYLHKGARPSKFRQLRDPQRRRQFASLVRRRARAAFVSTLPQRNRSGSPEWVSPTAVDAIEQLVARRVPVLLMYGSDDPLRRDFREARPGRLDEILADAGDLFELDETFDGILHGFPTLASQEAFTIRVEQWMERRVP